MAVKNYTPEENARTLASWNAWKDLCWINGLGLRLEGGRVVGTPEDRDRLRQMVRSAFLKRLRPYVDRLADETARSRALAELDCAMEFDAALSEYEHSEDRGFERYEQHHWGEADHVRKAKAWKDAVWQAVAMSKDPPLKVILGKLLGPTGVIRQIAEEWLTRTFSCRFVHDPETGKKVLYLDDSRDRTSLPEADEAGQSEVEKGRAEGFEQYDQEEREENCEQTAVVKEVGLLEADAARRPDESDFRLPKAWENELDAVFTPRTCCILFAHINGVRLYADSEILGTLGVGKSSANEEVAEKAPASFGRLSRGLREAILSEDAVLREFRKWLERKIRMEKAGRLILSRMASRTDGGARKENVE